MINILLFYQYFVTASVSTRLCGIFQLCSFYFVVLSEPIVFHRCEDIVNFYGIRKIRTEDKDHQCHLWLSSRSSKWLLRKYVYSLLFFLCLLSFCFQRDDNDVLSFILLKLFLHWYTGLYYKLNIDWISHLLETIELKVYIKKSFRFCFNYIWRIRNKTCSSIGNLIFFSSCNTFCIIFNYLDFFFFIFFL